MYFWQNRDQKSGSLNKMYEVAKISKQGFAKQRRRQYSYKEEEHILPVLVTMYW